LRATEEKQISAFLANKPGVVADLCDELGNHDVNIRAITVLDTVDVGTVRFVVDNVERAQTALRTKGAAFVVVPVVALRIANKPGAFAMVARKMALAGINIEYFYATASPDTEASLAVFRVSDHRRALELDYPD
jgi:hypothetical protein